MFPVFDLIQHSDSANVNIKYISDRQVLEVKAIRPIVKGDELLYGYFELQEPDEDLERISNFQALSNFGFASENTSAVPGLRCSVIYLNPADAQNLQLLIKIRKSVSAQ